MSMSKFKLWLDAADPYTIQRKALYKALFISTIMVYVYWIFMPVEYMAFILPFFMLSLYEMPIVSSFKKKEQLLLFISVGVLVVSVSFYLVYPFRVFFFFFSLLILTALYFLVLHYFYSLKNIVMLTLSTGTIVLGVEPEGNLQIAYGFISSIALASCAVFFCFKIMPNRYLSIWNKALQNFICYFEGDIENVLVDKKHKFIKEEIIHFEMVRHYQRLVGKKYLLPSFRMAVYIRNIQLSLDNLYYENKNDAFWLDVKQNLNTLRTHMPAFSCCPMPVVHCPPETNLQHYVIDGLNRAVIQWNRLCTLYHS